MSVIFLDGSMDADDILRSSAKQQLDSYADEWIIAFEGLQNALDAVEDVTNPKVRIIFNINENKVSIYDNGKGFPCDKTFFSLGKGEKANCNNPNIRGEHGVGLKMIILCSKQLELITRNKGKLWYARFNNGFKFLEKKDKEIFEYDYSEYERLPRGYNTLIEYSFPLSNEEPMRLLSIRNFIESIFKEYENITPHIDIIKNRNKASLFIEHYFRTHSYTGDVNRLFDNKKPAQVEVIILRDDSNHINSYPSGLITYWNEQNSCIDNIYHIAEFPCKYWDITEIYSNISRKGIFNEKLLKSFNPKVKHGGSNAWVLKIQDKNQLKEILLNYNLNNSDKIEQFDNLVQEKIKGIYIYIASASKSAKYSIENLLLSKADQIIAADGVITTNPVKAPKRGKNQSYLNNIHFVINISDRVNYGKQGIKNPKLLSTIYKYFEELYVSKLVELAVSVAGKIPAGYQDEDEPDSNVIDLHDIQSDISIKKVPRQENTLIAIFYELIGRGYINGIETYELSSYEKYDGKINIFSNNKNQFKKITKDIDLYNIEFKIHLSDLIKDFDDNSKSLQDLDLIIIWDKTIPIKTSNYYILDFEDSKFTWLGINGICEVLADMDGNQVPIIEIPKYL